MLVSAWLNVYTARTGASPGTWGLVLKLLNNAEFLLTFPGYFIAWKLGRFHGAPSWGSCVLGAAIGWPMFIAGVSCAALAGRWVLNRLAKRSDLPAGVGPGSGADQQPADPSRRRLIVGASLGVPALVAPAGAAYATFIEPLDLRIRRYTVPIRDLPIELEGLRLVQLSDTHYGPRVPAEHVAAAVQLALSLKPDLFLLTGDFVYDGPRYIEQAAELFRPLTQGPDSRPTLATLGNHDWYADGPECTRRLQAVGVRMLDNTRVFLDARTRTISGTGEPGRSLCIAGLGDLLEHHIDPGAALGGVHPEIPRLVLSHNPDAAEETKVVRGPRIDLMLSGHTHGGQCRFPLIGTPITLSWYGQKYNGGIAHAPTCRVLVSRGVGTSILPIRFGVPPEVVEVTLTREKA